MRSHLTGVEYAAEVTKLSPPLAVSGGLVAGLDLQSWVLIATLVYTVLQILLSLHKFLKDRNAEDGSE